VLAAVAVLLLLCPSGIARASDRITIFVAGIEKQIYLPAVLAERLGYFADQGLEVKLITSAAGMEAENELLTGAVQGAVGFYDHTIDLQARGKYVVSLVQFALSPGEMELVPTQLANDIRSPADLKGRTLGVAGLGSSTDFLTRTIAALHGLRWPDYRLRPIGSGDAFIDAMRKGEVAAGMTSEPTAGRMLKSGEAKMLVDLRTPAATRGALGADYPGASFYVPAAWMPAHRQEAQSLVTAFAKTMRFIATHSAAEIADRVPEAFFEGDRALYVERLAETKSMFTADGRMPAGGPEAVLKILSSFSKSVQGKQIDLQKTYSSEFIDRAAATIGTAE
jgi:NitT/TauT family transport system substrate-binding protein